MNKNEVKVANKKLSPYTNSDTAFEADEYKLLDDNYNHLQYINAGKAHATNPLIFHRYMGYHPFIKVPPPIMVYSPLQQSRTNPSESI